MTWPSIVAWLLGLTLALGGYWLRGLDATVQGHTVEITALKIKDAALESHFEDIIRRLDRIEQKVSR